MKSTASRAQNSQGSLYKEVRFSPTATPIRRAQSVSTSKPSWSLNYARGIGTGPVSRNASTTVSEYLEDARIFLEQQRVQFDNERALFAKERQLWESERQILKAKIIELEMLAKVMNQREGGSTTSDLLSKSSPFKGQVWEGSGVFGRPTRVFLHTETAASQKPLSSDQAHRQPGRLSLNAALSPSFSAVDRSISPSVPVPIEKVDSKLDGITLKSTALPPEVVARVMTPLSLSVQEASPSPPKASTDRPNVERRTSLKLRLSDLGPPQENLVRDAGHTPMAIIDGDLDTSQRTTGGVSPLHEENPMQPAATKVQQPVENSQSYFPDLPDDPALKEPLALSNNEIKDDGFLRELDQRLLQQARRILQTSCEAEGERQADGESASRGEPEPELKFKQSTNFGTAFGQRQCGEL